MSKFTDPLQPSDSPVHMIEADVLVIGGGVAGCLAVVGAAKSGARVVVCDKGGRIERSGSVGGGVDHFFAILHNGQEWDTPDFLLNYIPSLTEGVTDLDVAEKLVRGLPEMVHMLEKMGVDFHDPEAPDAPYYRHRVFGLPGEYTINFDGSNFKHIIGRAARQAGARILERTMVKDVLMEEGRPRGAVAFNIRTGEVYLILARAVILATGDVNRLSRNASGIPFDSWHLPYNTGDGQAMALRAGARLANMEFTESTLSPKGYSSQGMNAFVGGGAYVINSLGERFMFRYHPNGERARRTDLTHGVATEILEGRGPIYFDCRHLPPGDIDRLVNTLGVDRPAMPTFFKQKHIDLTREPFEISFTELSVRRGGVYFRGSGIHIDPEGTSSIPGIFAAGDCSSMSAGIAGASVMGYLAGQSAGRYAVAQPPPTHLDKEQTAHIVKDVIRPLAMKGGLSFHAFEDEVRSIVTDYIGYRREERRMKEAIQRLKALHNRESDLEAGDHHGLMRVYEARNIRMMAETLATTALERRESRGGAAHVRVDFPQTDDQTGLRMFMVEMVEDELQVTSRPTGLSSSPPEPISRPSTLTES